jgi:hypothetical protein
MASTSALATSPSANLASPGKMTLKVALTKGLRCFLGNYSDLELRSAGSTRDQPDPQTGLGCSATKFREVCEHIFMILSAAQTDTASPNLRVSGWAASPHDAHVLTAVIIG